MPRSMSCVMGEMTTDVFKHKFWKEGADKVCDDEEDIQGKIAIVTGSNTGIGKSAAQELAKRGAIVVMGVRNMEKGKEALDDIKEKIGQDAKLELMKIDVSDMQSVREFVQEFQKKYQHLNILVNNAGLMDTCGVLKTTKDGLEQHIATNHTGPFLLTNLLLDSLKKGAPSRVVCVASFVVALSTFDLEDVTSEPKTIKTEDFGSGQYYVSKLYNAICMIKLAKTLEGQGIKVFQLDPGFVKTNMSANVMSTKNWLLRAVSSAGRAMSAITPHQSCETIIYLSVAKSLANSDEAGKGEIYRFISLWKDGNKVLSEYDESDNSDLLYKKTRELIGLVETQ